MSVYLLINLFQLQPERDGPGFREHQNQFIVFVLCRRHRYSADSLCGREVLSTLNWKAWALGRMWGRLEPGPCSHGALHGMDALSSGPLWVGVPSLEKCEP